MKTWLKGIIIGLIPLVLAIISTVILIINLTNRENEPAMALVILLFSYLLCFYLLSFVFLIFAVLTGFVIHKSWKTKILAFLILILLIVSVPIYGFSGNPPEGEIETYKGIWSVFSTVTIATLLSDVQQLKEDGVNTISFGPFHVTDDKGNIQEIPLMKPITILLIQSAHRNGFRVFLVPDMYGPSFTGIENNTLFLEQAAPIVLEWAEIAEKYGVEMYAPMNEPSIIIDNQEALNQWAHEVAIGIKERYSGILVYKATEADWGFDNDYRGYDYVGLDIFPYDPEQTVEEFRIGLQSVISDGLEFAERDGAKGVIYSEIGVQIKANPEDVDPTTPEPFSLDYQKQAYEVFFEEGQKNNIAGYIFCCWGEEGIYGPDDVPAEEVMKKWFIEQLE